MLTLTALLDRVLGAETVRHECRHCGPTVDAAGGRCPPCDSADVATYRFT
ncbi:hypothetical protein [Haloglomus litoreum]|nr:hypothetical protein [Haloglomus sp. DT116]